MRSMTSPLPVTTPSEVPGVAPVSSSAGRTASSATAPARAARSGRSPTEAGPKAEKSMVLATGAVKDTSSPPLAASTRGPSSSSAQEPATARPPLRASQRRWSVGRFR